MTDETKKLFDAPWRVAKDDFDYAISSASNEPIVFDSGKDGEKNSNRISRLPELYDALMEAAKSYCQAADFDCPKKYCAWASSRKCKALKWLDLMKKVRDGE